MNRVCAAEDCECSLDGCRHDGRPKPAQARFCSRKCASRSKKARYRRRKFLGMFRARHPESEQLLVSTDSRSLTELYDRARPPARRAVDPVYSDFGDLPEDYDDDRQGDDGRGAGRGYFGDGMRVHQEAEEIRARYAARIKPLLASQARNGGVKLPAIAQLEAQCTAEVDALMKAHWRREAYERAAREQPKYLASAHERAVESAALTAFARDLGRGHRTASQTPTAGRSVHDAFYF